MNKLENKIIPYWRTSFGNGEADAIKAAIDSEHVSQGPIVKQFEQQLSTYLGVPYVVATTSGSMALLMSLLAAGVGPGDEVIVPNRTWIATAHAPFLLGATVKLIDVEADRPIMNARLIESAIGARTKAIIPVHMCGRSADMRTINAIAKKYKLCVIEDAAQALGSRNLDGYLGTQSDMGCFSFSVAKIISTGQGGVVVTSNENLFLKLVAMRTQGVGDVLNAEWTQPGFNFRFTDILAAIGISQLKVLDARIQKVKQIYKKYERGIADLPFLKLIPVNYDEGEVPVYIEILCNDREKLVHYLKLRGIQSRPFYPDLNTANYFNNHGYYPNSVLFGKNGLYLPAGPEQSLENIHIVIQALNEYKEL